MKLPMQRHQPLRDTLWIGSHVTHACSAQTDVPIPNVEPQEVGCLVLAAVPNCCRYVRGLPLIQFFPSVEDDHAIYSWFNLADV